MHALFRNDSGGGELDGIGRNKAQSWTATSVLCNGRKKWSLTLHRTFPSNYSSAVIVVARIKASEHCSCFLSGWIMALRYKMESKC